MPRELVVSRIDRAQATGRAERDNRPDPSFHCRGNERGESAEAATDHTDGPFACVAAPCCFGNEKRYVEFAVETHLVASRGHVDGFLACHRGIDFWTRGSRVVG